MQERTREGLGLGTPRFNGREEGPLKQVGKETSYITRSESEIYLSPHQNGVPTASAVQRGRRSNRLSVARWKSNWMGVFVSGHIGVTNQGELSRQGMRCSLMVAYF